MRVRFLLLVCTFPLTAGASEPFDFTRVAQPALLGTGEVTGAVGAELQRPISEYERNPGGGGGGGGGTGLGGRDAYEGVQYRGFAYVGLAPWLVLGAEQTVQQPQADVFELKTLAPELRFVWNGVHAFSRLPVTLSTFAGARLRLVGEHRRGSSAVGGMGLDRDFGRWVVSSSLAFEKSVDGIDDTGLRYGEAIGLRFAVDWTAAMEAWGVLVWTTGAPFQQDHHLGPSLKWAFMEHGWVSSNFAGAIRERPHRGFTDWTWMTQIGVAF